MKLEKVYWPFWIVACLYSIFTIRDVISGGTSDVNVHDTYFVYKTYQFPLLVAVAYFLLGLGYWLIIVRLKRKLINWLTLLHAIILIGSIILYWFVNVYESYLMNEIINDFGTKMILVISAILIITIGQPIYVINLLIALCKKPSAIR